MPTDSDRPLNTGTEVIDRVTCLGLLAQEEVGRVAFVDEHGRLEIFPVNYSLDGDAVVFRTADGTKLIAAGRDVVFEVDRLEPSTRTAWSVVIRGVASLVESAGGAGPDPWANAVHPFVMRIPPGEVTGRRVGTRPLG